MSIGFSVAIHFHDDDSKHGQKINEVFIRLKKRKSWTRSSSDSEKGKVEKWEKHFLFMTKGSFITF